MRTSEIVVLGYLAYIAVMAWVQPIGAGRRAVVAAVTALDAALLLWLSDASGRVAAVVRDWIPGLHLLIGYWLSGAFFLGPAARFEARLAAWDRRVFEDWRLSVLVRRCPRLMLEYLELAYLSVYPMVPLGFAVLYRWGSRGDAEVDAYWTVVLVTGFVCYGLLPWLPSRPPIARGLHLEIEARAVAVRRINARIRRTASVQANTFPSGHAATAVAVALAAGAVVPAAFLPLLLVAASITLASIIGRYHYAADAVFGIVLASGVWLVVRWSQ